MRDLGGRLAEQLRAGRSGAARRRARRRQDHVGAGDRPRLGVSGAVLSPTFVIARVHLDGRLPLVHVDAYRLSSIAEVDDLDLDASLEESVTLVEWGEGLVEGLAGDRLEVTIERPTDDSDETRVVDIVRCWGAVERRQRAVTRCRAALARSRRRRDLASRVGPR